MKKVGHYVSEKENVDEDILKLGKGPMAVEVDLMQPLNKDVVTRSDNISMSIYLSYLYIHVYLYILFVHPYLSISLCIYIYTKPKAPKVHIPALNHIGLWVDDLPECVRYLSQEGKYLSVYLSIYIIC